MGKLITGIFLKLVHICVVHHGVIIISSTVFSDKIDTYTGTMTKASINTTKFRASGFVDFVFWFRILFFPAISLAADIT